MQNKPNSSFIHYLLTVFMLFFSSVTEAWNAHTILTYPALKNIPTLAVPAFPAEPLPDFLLKERSGLIKLLKENETWSRAHIPYYPPLPDNIAFGNAKSSTPLLIQFLYAIRVNPTLHFPLFLQYPPNVSHRIHGHPLVTSAVMLPNLAATWVYISNPPLEAVTPGTLVSPLEVISTASEEPDYGMDVNLWEDNGSAFGQLYRWGPQPFGNKTVAFSTQSPFHIGFYYENAVLFTGAPVLKRTYPEYRIHLYLTLARYAFKTAHPYWGYRFLGWAIHYAQDLTQPYHSTVAPNINTSTLIYASFLDNLGSHTAKQNIIQLVTNRHFTLENYEYYLLINQLASKPSNSFLLQALSDTTRDGTYPAYTDDYPRLIIAKESHDRADNIDSMIRKVFPKKYVADPNYIFFVTEDHVNVFDEVQKNPPPELHFLNTELTDILRDLGSHTRNILKYAISN